MARKLVHCPRTLKHTSLFSFPFVFVFFFKSEIYRRSFFIFKFALKDKEVEGSFERLALLQSQLFAWG